MAIDKLFMDRDTIVMRTNNMKNNKFKVLHLIAGDMSGGAAKGAHNLHQSLLKNNVDSIVLNNHPSSNQKKVLSTSKTFFQKQLNNFRKLTELIIVSFYPKRIKNRLFSTGLVGFNFLKTKAYQEADIIHLHWINNGFINIKHLAKVDKPIIWTIRDMWPLTGGCHYSLDCRKYESSCGSCPQLNSHNNFDLSTHIMRNKLFHLPKSITAVGISPWVSDVLKKSAIFKDKNVLQINNSINCDDFKPIDTKLARASLGIQTNKKIILVGANGINDFYKGFDKFLSAVKCLDTSKYFLLFFGKVDETNVTRLGFEYKSLGYISDLEKMCLAYSSATVFVAPSIMEAFGKTIVESMSCMTPVVCFDATGPAGIVSHLVDGYKAIAFDPEDLARGIEWVTDSSDYPSMCKTARVNAVEKFDNEVICKKYISLYENCLVS